MKPLFVMRDGNPIAKLEFKDKSAELQFVADLSDNTKKEIRASVVRMLEAESKKMQEEEKVAKEIIPDL